MSAGQRERTENIMPKKKDKKVKNLDEFRKLNTKEAQGHLQYVSGKKGKQLESVGVTHAKKTRGQKNIPLKKNPDPKDKEPAYIRPKLTTANIKKYGGKLDGLGLSAEDKKQVWELIERLRKQKQPPKKK